MISLLLAGCGDGRPERVKVSGRVLIDGKPLSYGTIRFVPEGARPSYARIGQDGSFTLTCFGDEDGIIPGTHRVEINAGEALSETKVKWHAPGKYASYKTSGITETIEKSTDSLTIELSWDGKEPYVQRL